MAQDTVSLEQVITDFVISMESDDYANTASDTLIRNLALRGIREMGFDILKRLKATELNIDLNTNTVTLPADYVDLVKIGIVGADGLVYIFGENKTKTYSPTSSLIRFLITCLALMTLFIATMCTPQPMAAYTAMVVATTAESTE